MSYRMYKGVWGNLYLDLDESFIYAGMLNGTYEPRKVQEMKDHLNLGEVFVDVGAHVGYFTLIASKIVGAAGLVIAFEPHPDNYKHLSQMIKANGLRNVKAYNGAVGIVERSEASEKLARLYIGEQSGMHTLIPDIRSVGKHILVRKYSLNDLLSIVRYVNMVKIDVEGAEGEIVEDTDWAALTPVGNTLTLLLDVHPELGVEPVPLLQKLHDKGFSTPIETPDNLHEIRLLRRSPA